MTLRMTASPGTLVVHAVGGPRALYGKLTRAARTARLYFDPAEIDRRLDRLNALSLVDHHPTRLQILFGGFDMLRFLISPAARDYYQLRGISFSFHQILRILDDPVSMIDPTGFLSDRETIIGHVMQVVHLNPVFDLELLQFFDRGLEAFERELEEMVAGTHPRHGTIGAIVEDPDYHARLLDYVRRYRSSADTPSLLRERRTGSTVPGLAAAERTFATLRGFVGYCDALPRHFSALLLRAIRVRTFPNEAVTDP